MICYHIAFIFQLCLHRSFCSRSIYTYTLQVYLFYLFQLLFHNILHRIIYKFYLLTIWRLGHLRPKHIEQTQHQMKAHFSVLAACVFAPMVVEDKKLHQVYCVVALTLVMRTPPSSYNHSTRPHLLVLGTNILGI